MENQLLHTASTICHIAFASTGITTPSDEQGFLIFPTASIIACVRSTFMSVVPLIPACHSYRVKTGDLKNHFPAYILQLVQELAPLKGLPVHPEKSGLIKSWKPCFQPVRCCQHSSGQNIFRAHFLRMIKTLTVRRELKILTARKCNLSHQLSP